MSVKILNNMVFSKLITSNSIRCDYKYYKWYNHYINDYKRPKKLKEFVDSYFKGFAFKSDDFQKDGDLFVLKGINFDNDFFINYDNMDFLPSDFYINNSYDNFKLQKNDIVIYLVGATIGKMVLVREDNKMLLNQNAIAIRLKPEYNPLVYTYILSYIIMQMVNEVYRVSGYSFLRVEDLFSLQIPELSNKEQKELLEYILIKEKEIKLLKENIVDIKDIIDQIFSDYFKYDYLQFNKLKDNKMYLSSFLEFGNNVDVRFSAKFHRPAGKFVYQELLSRSYKKIKECLISPMITGKGIKPKDFGQSDYFYVSMADISTWKLDIDNLNNVSNEYVNKNKTKQVKELKAAVSTEIKINDILMIRSGEGAIGKVAIVKDDIKAIFCDFLIRMRFNEDIINPDFIYYYFRTSYFQYLIEINKKGLGNNTNIFPNQIKEFPIPDIPLIEQNKIVSLIDSQIKIQKDIENQILYKRNEIKERLLKSIKIE